MNASMSLQFLRPSLLRSSRSGTATTGAYAQFYDAVRNYSRITARPGGLDQMNRVQDSIADYVPAAAKAEVNTSGVEETVELQREDVKKRIKELEAAGALNYPRVLGYHTGSGSIQTCKQFRERFETQENGKDEIILRGRVYSARTAGSKLIFLDIVQNGSKVQAICNLGKLDPSIASEEFKAFRRMVKRGDIIEIRGHAYRTERGEESLRASKLPIILTPALASLPTSLDDRETLVKNRHADMLVNRQTAETLKIRSQIFQNIRDFLLQDDFLEVQTPILARSAGGAVARPFTTFATEFPDKALALRIAPEIWLKRLIIGGLDRVFEIGPVFRNEGVDGTHNPEFYTCEFYKAFADLEDLMSMTEEMLSKLGSNLKEVHGASSDSLSDAANIFAGPYKRVEFVPSLESAINRRLPDLSSPTAQSEVTALLSALSVPLPAAPTLPRLLDKLSSHYLEPLCVTPTFITNHPACLAPLAKSFVCPTTQQLVSARAELFVQHKEIANMYEEENSPFEQRRKFVEQKDWIDEENKGEVDEGYIEAMEWGLPPTGGWGMGLDRLVMLFSGRERIGEVLSFGSLRNVVGLGRERK